MHHDGASLEVKLPTSDRHLPLRQRFFCRTEYSQLVLLAFFLAKPADACELLECYLGIKRFASL